MQAIRKKPTACENPQWTEQKRAMNESRCVVFLSSVDFHPTRKSIWLLWMHDDFLPSHS
jgi:hypothetical protein